jgi:hypothetical protein
VESPGILPDFCQPEWMRRSTSFPANPEVPFLSREWQKSPANFLAANNTIDSSSMGIVDYNILNYLNSVRMMNGCKTKQFILGAKVVGSNPATPTKVQPNGWTFSFYVRLHTFFSID